MGFIEKLQTAWNNRSQIAEGFYNTYLSHDKEIEAEGYRRRALCESNQCGFYDKEGKTEKVVVKGKPSCAGCGCNIELKTNCMSCHCFLKDMMVEPLWDAIMTEEQEKEINQKKWEAQFKK